MVNTDTPILQKPAANKWRTTAMVLAICALGLGASRLAKRGQPEQLVECDFTAQIGKVYDGHLYWALYRFGSQPDLILSRPVIGGSQKIISTLDRAKMLHSKSVLAASRSGVYLM